MMIGDAGRDISFVSDRSYYHAEHLIWIKSVPLGTIILQTLVEDWGLART